MVWDEWSGGSEWTAGEWVRPTQWEVGGHWSTLVYTSLSYWLPPNRPISRCNQPALCEKFGKCKTMVSEKDCSRNWKMNIANSPLCLSNGFSLISPVSQLDIGYPPNNTNQATLPGKFLKKVNFVWIWQLEVRDDPPFEIGFICWNVKKRSRGQYILLKANKELEVEFLKAILGRCKDITAKPKFLD